MSNTISPRLHTLETVGQKYDRVLDFFRELLDKEQAVELHQDDLQREFHTAASLTCVLARLRCIIRVGRVKGTKPKGRGAFAYIKTDLLSYVTSSDLVNIERVRTDNSRRDEIIKVLEERRSGDYSTPSQDSNQRLAYTQPNRNMSSGFARKINLEPLLFPLVSAEEKLPIVKSVVVKSLEDVKQSIMEEAIKFFRAGNDNMSVKLRDTALSFNEDELKVQRILSSLIDNNNQ